MATIPNVNRVSSVAPDAQQNRVITMDPRAVGGGGREIAEAVQRGAFNVLEQKSREDDALARVRASNALFERETQISQINSDLAEQVRLGNLGHDKLEEAYTSAVGKLDPLKMDGLDEAGREGVGLAEQRLQLQGQDAIRKLAISARTDAAKGDMATMLDLIGKDAAMPGADIAKLNSRLDSEAADMAGRLAYGEMWPAKKQEAKDANWATQATQRSITAGNNLGELRKLQHDLTDANGFYAGKLDPEKRNIQLNSVTGRIYQVEQHNEQVALRREMKAERTLLNMDKHASTGMPASPAQLQSWQADLKGTSLAGEYNSRIQQMNEVQGLRRLPFDQQRQYVDNKRQQLAAHGGTVADVTNLNRLETMLESNIKLAKEDPLTFIAQNTGADVPPLDLTGLATPDGQARLAEQLGSRYDAVNALRKTLGPEVSRVPLKAGEQAMLAAVINQADDNTKLQLFGVLAQSAPTGADYAAAIKPLVADQPVTVLAGMAKFRDLKGADGTDVPKMLLQGQKILADKSVPQPKENLLRAAFDDQVGLAMTPGTPQREQAYQGFKALYASTAMAAGKAYEDGDDLDKATTRKAIQLVTGGISERAGQKVVKPYNMEDKAFDKAVDIELEGLAKRTEFPLGQLEDMPLSPVPGKEGVYYLLNAGRIQVDPKTNEPMIVRVK